MSSAIDRRMFLASLPALAAMPRLFAQGAAGVPIPVDGLSQLTLTVSDVKRSVDFYQGLFGMPVLARQGSTVVLRIGNGPRFMVLRPAAAGERPSLSGFGFSAPGLNLDSAVKMLESHTVAAAPAGSEKPGPRQYRCGAARPMPEALRPGRESCSWAIPAASSFSCTAPATAAAPAQTAPRARHRNQRRERV